MVMPKILVVVDDSETVDSLINILKKEECYDVKSAGSDLFAASLDTDMFDVVITDFTTKDPEERKVLDYVVEHHPEIKCLIFAKHASITNSVEALKKGAFDYLTKSTDSYDLIKAVKKATDEEDRSTPKRIKKKNWHKRQIRKTDWKKPRDAQCFHHH